MLGGALLWYNQISYPPGERPTNQRIIILQEFSHRSESSELPTRLPSLGIWYLREGAPRAFGFQSWQGLSAGAPQDWGKQGLHSWRVHKVSCSLGPRAKQWLHRSLGQTYLCVLEGLLGRCWSTVAHRRGKDTGPEAPRNVHQHELSQRLPFWHWDLAPPNSLPIYDKNSPKSGHRENLLQHN